MNIEQIENLNLLFKTNVKYYNERLRIIPPSGGGLILFRVSSLHTASPKLHNLNLPFGLHRPVTLSNPILISGKISFFQISLSHS